MNNTLALLNTLFNISLALTIIFTALTIALFFHFKVIDVLNELSGKARTEATKKMQENYAVTGSLRQSDRPGPVSGDVQKKKQTGSINNADSKGLMLTEHLAASSPDQSIKAVNFKITKEQLIIHTQEHIN